MGLTIHYYFSLPRRFSLKQVEAKMEALRQRCLDLPFKEVSDKILVLSQEKKDNMDFYRFIERGKDGKAKEMTAREEAEYSLLYGATENLQWTLVKTNPRKPLPIFQSRFKLKQVPYGYDNLPYGRYETRVPPLHAVGFHTWPGEGCEEFNIKIGLSPKTFSPPETDSRFHCYARGPLKSQRKGWHGRGFCKTQYANDPRCGGTQNFIRCHLLVIAILDAAKELGFEVNVSDEGGFWEKRDVQALVKEIGQWDKMLAAMFGAFQGAAEKAGMKAESPLQGRPDFEKLEHEGMKSPEAQNMAKLFNAVKAKIS